MIIDLDQLKARHPLLPVEVAAALGFLAALALQRRHQPGVSLSAEVHGATTTHAITCQWVVHRRLQRRQYGDWLLVEQGSGRKVVFEIGGLDEGSLTSKLKGELAQVVKSPLPYVSRRLCRAFLRRPGYARRAFPDVSRKPR